MAFTVSNTGTVPVSLAASVDPESLFAASCPGTVGPGESVSVSVRFLTDHLPTTYDPELADEEFTGRVTISHGVCDQEPIEVPVSVHVWYEFVDSGFLSLLSDDEGAALCGRADLMLMKRMFADLRLAFEGLPRPGCEEVFSMRLLDTRDRYELIARSESDEVLATCREPTSVKWIELTVAPDTTLSYDVRLRDNPRG